MPSSRNDDLVSQLGTPRPVPPACLHLGPPALLPPALAARGTGNAGVELSDLLPVDGEKARSGRGGRLTSLQASSLQCFAFYKTASKTWGAMFFKNIVENIAWVSKKCDVFTQCFRFQKAHPETDSMARSLLIFRPRRPHSQKCALFLLVHLSLE